jgi:GNAT superfamily N-acetyltransferase
MTQFRELSFFYNSEAFMELDSTLITQETIDEIGAASNPNIIALHHFGIAAAWRNKGIGEQVLKGFIKQMKGKCGYIVILHNKPEQFRKHPDVPLYEIQGVELAGLENDPEKAQWKLNAFWQRCGFRLFKNYDNVWICNVDQFVPGPWKFKLPVI